MPKDLTFARSGVGMDWGTTRQHQAAVNGGSMLSSGAVWIRSSWLSSSGSSDLWRAEALRCKRDQGAIFARVDRSQSSELDRLTALGLQAASGLANVDARNGNIQSLVMSRNIFFDSEGPGVRELYDHLCAYHRDRDGKIVEEEDDDVDACGYLVSGLTESAGEYVPPSATPIHYGRPPAQTTVMGRPRLAPAQKRQLGGLR